MISIPSSIPRLRRSRRAAFLLLETMLGVAVFAIGVLALARCVDRCLEAETAKAQDQRARLALENGMAEIESHAVKLDEKPREEKLKGMFKGITLQESRVPFPLSNEKDEKLPGLFVVTLQAVWTTRDGPQSKGLTFYQFQPQGG